MRIGLISPGDLGAALAVHAVGRGVAVMTALDGRSARTRELAASAGIEDVGSLEALVDGTDLVISLVPPAEAARVADALVAAIRSTGSTPTIVDANSISPGTIAGIAATVEGAGARFVDAAVLSTPPRDIGTTRFYASGSGIDDFVAFGHEAGLVVRPMDGALGRASALKMAYAALTKGFPAIATGLLVTAHAFDVYDELIAELSENQVDSYSRMQKMLPRVPAVAERWIGEMDEIALTFEAAGLPPRMFEGAADIYRTVAATSLRTTPEAVDLAAPLERVVSGLAADIRPGAVGRGTAAERADEVAVLTPAAERFYQAELRPIAPRVASLAGARVGYIDNGFTSGAAVHEAVRAALEAGGATAVIEHKKYWRPLEPTQIQALVDGADVVVCGLCNTPPSTSWGLQDSIALEKAGIPTVALATAHYEELLEETLRSEGMPDLRRVILPYPLEGQPAELVRSVADRAVGPIVAALTETDGDRSVSVAKEG